MPMLYHSKLKALFNCAFGSDELKVHGHVYTMTNIAGQFQKDQSKIIIEVALTSTYTLALYLSSA